MLRFVAVAILLLVSTVTRAAVIEVPQNGADMSGVLYVSGWKCPPNDNISIRFDGGTWLRAASKLPRGDTAGVCGNDGANGYILQFNFNLLGDGTHTVNVRQGGTQFGAATFNVTTFGQTFMRGAMGSFVLEDFPTAGDEAVIEWNEASQNFLITGRGSGVVVPTPRPTARPTPTPASLCPSDGPIQDLRRDCSDFLYGYLLGAVVAGISSNGTVVAICLTSPGESILCFGGPVTSATTFGLTVGNTDGGPFLPLGAGSAGNIALGGQRLNFTIRLGFDTFEFNGFTYFTTEPFSSTDAAASNEPRLGGAIQDMLAALLAAIEGGAGEIEQAQGANAEAFRYTLEAIQAEMD